MDKHQKEYLAKKAEKMNSEWLKTGKFVEYLDKLNLLNKKILDIISKIPKTLKYVLMALALANLGIWFRWIYDLIKLLP